MDKKPCSKCGEPKRPSEFAKNTRQCKICKNKYGVVWRLNRKASGKKPEASPDTFKVPESVQRLSGMRWV